MNIEKYLRVYKNIKLVFISLYRPLIGAGVDDEDGEDSEQIIPGFDLSILISIISFISIILIFKRIYKLKKDKLIRENFNY